MFWERLFISCQQRAGVEKLRIPPQKSTPPSLDPDSRLSTCWCALALTRRKKIAPPSPLSLDIGAHLAFARLIQRRPTWVNGIWCKCVSLGMRNCTYACPVSWRCLCRNTYAARFFSVTRCSSPQPALSRPTAHKLGTFFFSSLDSQPRAWPFPFHRRPAPSSPRHTWDPWTRAPRE